MIDLGIAVVCEGEPSTMAFQCGCVAPLRPDGAVDPLVYRRHLVAGHAPGRRHWCVVSTRGDGFIAAKAWDSEREARAVMAIDRENYLEPDPIPCECGWPAAPCVTLLARGGKPLWV